MLVMTLLISSRLIINLQMSPLSILKKLLLWYWRAEHSRLQRKTQYLSGLSSLELRGLLRTLGRASNFFSKEEVSVQATRILWRWLSSTLQSPSRSTTLLKTLSLSKTTPCTTPQTVVVAKPNSSSLPNSLRVRRILKVLGIRWMRRRAQTSLAKTTTSIPCRWFSN